MSTMGERLKEAREKKNLKQTQVKAKTGINNKTLSGYENNVSEPDYDTLRILAELYDVQVNWLITGKDTSKQTAENEKDKLIAAAIRRLPEEKKDFLLEVIKQIEG